MTSQDIQRSLVGNYTSNLWNIRQVLVALNTTGLVGWEADVVLLHKSGWVWEVEIKVSASDFRREFTAKTKMDKHNALQSGRLSRTWRNWGEGVLQENIVRKFFFAMPISVYEKVADEIPSYAGVIVIDPDGVNRAGIAKPKIIKKAKELTAIKAPKGFRDSLLSAVYYRHWQLVHRATRQ